MATNNNKIPSFDPFFPLHGAISSLPEPESWREKTVSNVTPYIQWWQSLSPANKDLTEQQARKKALGTTHSIFGNLKGESFGESVGALDFTPFALPFVYDEVKRGYSKAEQGTDYIMPTVEAGFGIAEAIPLTVAIAKTTKKPVTAFLKGLKNKIKGISKVDDVKPTNQLTGDELFGKKYIADMFPRFVYHSPRGRNLEDGIKLYEHKNFKDMNMPEGKGIYLSHTPLDNQAVKIDVSKLPIKTWKDLQQTGQAEGYMVFNKNIPPDAIVKETENLGALKYLNPNITRRKFIGGAGATAIAGGLGALSKVKSAVVPNNVDEIIAEFAKPMVETFEPKVPYFANPTADISGKRMTESKKEWATEGYIDSILKNPSKENIIKMLNEMSGHQQWKYGEIQNKVTRSLQLRAMKDGAEPVLPHLKHMGEKEPHSKWGYGNYKVEEPMDITDVKNSVYDTSTEVNKKEIKLIEDYYDQLLEKGYSAQEIFDNPYLLKKENLTENQIKRQPHYIYPIKDKDEIVTRLPSGREFYG
jgi:hypothetical protein